METKECDVLVIGAGPAGLTAAIYAARAGLKTVVLEQLAVGGAINMTPEIGNFPGFLEISGAELGEKMSEQATHAGAEILYDEINEINFVSKMLQCQTCMIHYNALIIASGASPRELGVEREDEFVGAGIHFCALCDGAFYKGKDIVIIGGGNQAVEEAIYMSTIAKSITLVNNIDKLIAQDVLIKQMGDIPVHQNSVVKKILGESKITGIEIETTSPIDNKKQTTVINCDAVFVSIGRKPNTDIFRGKLELSKGGYIVVDEKLGAKATDGANGIFAAGDVIDKNIRQIITACADGAIAATYAAEYVKSNN